MISNTVQGPSRPDGSAPIVDHSPEDSIPARTAQVLIAEDNLVTRTALAHHVKKTGFETLLASDGEQAKSMMSDEVDVVLLDQQMPKASGMECLVRFRKDFPDAAVIMVTSSDDVANAVEAMKLGATEYITKPFDPEELMVVVRRAAEAAETARENRRLKAVVGHSLPTRSFQPKWEGMRRLLEQLDRVAQLDSTVHIRGESGTGKTTLARMIHQRGSRADGPFVVINCASLPRDLIEAELFGHAKGAFTGAVGDRPGRAEIADGGTLFLDEIGDLPLELQPKLLTFLQDRTIQRIGSNKEIKLDVRLISATHQDIGEMCEQKRFRQDLFYRLNVLSLEVPAVRDRLADVPDLAKQVLKRIAERREVQTPRLSDEALQLMCEYHWPGNIREMENVLERATAFCDDAFIRPDALEIEVLNAPGEESKSGGGRSLAGMTIAEIEKMAIMETLEACGGNKAMTARTLGISEKSIYNKMRKHGLNQP